MKNKSPKKFIVLFLFLVIVPLLGAIFLGYIDFGSKHSYQENVLDVAFTWGDSPEAVQEFFEEFKSSMDLPLVVDTRLREDDIEELLSGENPPDVIVLSTSELVRQYQSSGTLSVLDNVLDPQVIDTDDFFPASISQCQTEEGLICLPWGNDVLALFWNKDLFAAAGLDPESTPRSLAELSAMAKDLSIYNQEKGEFEQIGFLPDFPRSHLGLYTHLNGGSWPSTDQLTSPGDLDQSMLDAISWELSITQPYDLNALNDFNADVNNYRNSGHPVFAERRVNCQQCHRTSPGSSEKMPDHAFYNQQVAMLVDGQWQDSQGYLPTYAPEINYGVAPVPASSEHSSLFGSSIIQGPVVIIPAAAKDSSAAAEFLSWLFAPETIAESSQVFGFLPSRESAAALMTNQTYTHLDLFLSILRHPNTTAFPSSQASEQINAALTGAEKSALHKEPGLDTFLKEYSDELMQGN